MSTRSFINTFKADVAHLMEQYSRYRLYGSLLIDTLDRDILPQQDDLIQRMSRFMRERNLTDDEFQILVPLIRAVYQLKENTLLIREQYLAHHPEEIPMSELQEIKNTFDQLFYDLETIEDKDMYAYALEEMDSFLRHHLSLLQDIPETHRHYSFIRRLMENMEYALNSITSEQPPRTTTTTLQ